MLAEPVGPGVSASAFGVVAQRPLSVLRVDRDMDRAADDLLQVFAENPNKVLSRDQLLQATRNRDAGPFDRAIDMQITRLRRKVEVDADKPVLIKAVRGAGYIFTCAVRKA